MLRGRQKLKSFNNKQNVFKERARSFHNPLQLRKQPAFTSPLSARLFQPPNGRQRLRLATSFFADRGTAWARHAMHNLSSNLCNLRKTCSLPLFLRNAWRSREEGIFSRSLMLLLRSVEVHALFTPANMLQGQSDRSRMLD